MNAAVRQIILGRPSALALGQALFAKYGAAGIYVPDFTPARLAASGLSRMFTTAGGGTAVASVADTIGVLIEESQGAAIGPDLIVNGAFAADTDWTKDAMWTIAGGVATHAPAGSGTIRQNIAFVAGALYRVQYDVTAITVGSAAIQFIGGTTVQSANALTAGTHVAYMIAAAGNNSFRVSGSSTGDASVDNVSCRRISGNHANQATAGSRGTLRQVGSRYVWRGDGVDDNLLTTLLPTAAFTMIFGVEMNAASDVIAGASVGANIIKLATHSDGALRLFAGTTSAAVTAGDIRDIPGVAWLSISGADYYAGWKPFEGTAETVTGTFAGAIPATQPLRLGAENDDGTAVTFGDMDLYNGLAMQAQMNAAEIAAVAGVYSR